MALRRPPRHRRHSVLLVASQRGTWGARAFPGRSWPPSPSTLLDRGLSSGQQKAGDTASEKTALPTATWMSRSLPCEHATHVVMVSLCVFYSFIVNILVPFLVYFERKKMKSLVLPLTFIFIFHLTSWQPSFLAICFLNPWSLLRVAERSCCLGTAAALHVRQSLGHSGRALNKHAQRRSQPLPSSL